jgi:hypothetical protein
VTGGIDRGTFVKETMDNNGTNDDSYPEGEAAGILHNIKFSQVAMTSRGSSGRNEIAPRIHHKEKKKKGVGEL